MGYLIVKADERSDSVN